MFGQYLFEKAGVSEGPVELYDSVVIRLSGEISIKSEGVRRFWQRKLVRFLRGYIKELGLRDVKILEERSRIYLFFDNNISESHFPLLDRIVHTFGISSISLAKRCESDLEAIKECAGDLVSNYLEALNGKKEINSFGIVCKKSLSPLFGSTEVRYDVGAYIKDKFNLKVDLTNPDLKIYIDVREDLTFVYFDEIPCYGGLPYGVQEKLVVLCSGGPDSTLAAWLTLRRGAPIVLVYYDFGVKELRQEAKRRAMRVAELLFKKWTPNKKGKMYIVELDNVVRSILKLVDDKRLYYVLLKRFMFKIAYLIAGREGAVGVVSGEILGEHASQTSWNLNIISSRAELAIHRPVFGFDKTDVFKLLRIIDQDLYDASSLSIEPCREITGAKPTTNAPLDKILFYEERILSSIDGNLNKLIDEAYVVEY